MMRRRNSGFTILEMLVAVVIMMAVTGTIFGLMNPAQGVFEAQPEVSDMQQRLRVVNDAIGHDLMMAGAGTYIGSGAGALYNFFAPVMPYAPDDPPETFKDNTITLLYIPPTPAQTSVIRVLGNANSQEVRVDKQEQCGDSKHDSLCGFSDEMRVIFFDIDGTWDLTTITQVQDEPSMLQFHTAPGVKLSSEYDSGYAVVTEISAHTYYLNEVPATNTYQLMHWDGYQTRLPLVDNIIKLQFQYFGDAQPPRLFPGKSLAADSKPPWTTYGPRPPILGTDLHEDDEYGAGENCAFQVLDGAHVSRLAVLAEGLHEVELTEDELTDGPWCPNQESATRFDADLLRIRRVRVNMRVQVAQATLRGPAGVLFSKGGTGKLAERLVPDQEITFDIAPRNMNLGR
jgi:type II secretory pathway pseudopilin PulG